MGCLFMGFENVGYEGWDRILRIIFRIVVSGILFVILIFYMVENIGEK